jgi:hypothetical protein
VLWSSKTKRSRRRLVAQHGVWPCRALAHPRWRWLHRKPHWAAGRAPNDCAKRRVSVSLGARPYMISEGTLDECIQQFMQLREAQRHLYEIHTVPQSDLVGAILSTDHIVELARLSDFLGK